VAEVDVRVVVFRGDDAGYLSWLAGHPDVSCWTSPGRWVWPTPDCTTRHAGRSPAPFMARWPTCTWRSARRPGPSATCGHTQRLSAGRRLTRRLQRLCGRVAP